MTSMERVQAALSHRESDRVPFFLLLNLHGAKELDLSPQAYFAKPEYVVEGQLRLRARYGHDCYYMFHHAPLEAQAWGGEVVFTADGPPNTGEPPLRDLCQIDRLASPTLADCPGLQGVLQATAMLKERVGNDAPLIGVVMSPFSLPVLQCGFEAYLRLLVERGERLDRLMALNEEFCVAWANAQLQAGATAICYFDPVASPTIVPRSTYLALGQPVARRTLARIQGPTATHMASGRVEPILGDVADTGTAAVGVCAAEDLAKLKAAAAGRVALLGNLSGNEMPSWTPEQAAAVTRQALREGGPGGGFILSDHHGEIPWQVPSAVLSAIADTVHEFGRYPLGGQ